VLETDEFHLEPLGPRHHHADHAAWMSSIEHICSTPGYPDGQLADAGTRWLASDWPWERVDRCGR
jgi:hypothetical protein